MRYSGSFVVLILREEKASGTTRSFISSMTQGQGPVKSQPLRSITSTRLIIPLPSWEKGDQFRIIKLEKRTVQLIQLYIKKYRIKPKPLYQHRIFINQQGEELTRHGIYRICKKYLSIDPSPKTTQVHQACTRLPPFKSRRYALHGVSPITDIKNRLGHDNIQSTTIYLHLDLNHRRHIQKDFIRYMQSVIHTDSKIEDLLQWESDKDLMDWLDSL